ncbi:MAG: hypothetical protein G3M70_02515 [Candidatus Nitronauta litoralis]|uniref:Uncharacterized protein n=1 Tax=Candidatus Nitronauta litoralis TaxID=2705533 RepID=A0A7T0BTN4_9BACT|nr:MAG: hypothetical protein G3M70_02515 [Candidatus Nitronauta litoralis]
MLTLIRVIIFIVLFTTPILAQEIKTRGDCSPAIFEAEGAGAVSLRLNCYINDLPLDSIVRQGKAKELLKALKKGVSAETIIQGFALGNTNNLSGVGFFKKVIITDLSKFLREISKHININNRIYLKNDAYTTLFWLAAEAQRKDIISIITAFGMAIHIDDHRFGGHHDTFLRKEFFPIISLIRNGVITVKDTEVLEKLLENSFIFPEFNSSFPVSTDVSYNFEKKTDLRNKIIAGLPNAKSRKPFDMANIPNLCQLASKSGDFDWCERLKSVSSFYLSDDKTGTHWPYSVKLLGLLNIRSDYAVFLMHHTRGRGSLGLFYVPRKGTKYKMSFWNTAGSNSPPCWNKKLNGYKTDCWRLYSLEQDFFDKKKFTGKRGFPIYTASDKNISW